MDCGYKYVGKDITLLDLTKKYYSETNKLENKNIYSQDEIQDSTINIILGAQAKSEAKTYVTDFIVKNQSDLLTSVMVDQDRLGVEFIKVNYIHNYIEEELNKNSNPDVKDVTISQTKELDEIINLFPNVDPKILQYYLNQVNDIIEISEKSIGFSKGIKSLIGKVVDGFSTSSTEYGAIFEEMYNENPYIFKEGDKQQWREKIDSIVEDIYKRVSNHGRILKNVMISTDDNSKAQLHSSIDLVVVDKDGNAHIYLIKLSKNWVNIWFK